MFEWVDGFIEANVIYFVAAFIGVIFFWQFRKWNIDRLRERSKIRKEEIKADPNAGMMKDELMQWIQNPELAIQALNLKKKAAKDQNAIQGIDTQIKMLEALVKIPAPIRPMVGKIGISTLKKIEGIVNEF